MAAPKTREEFAEVVLQRLGAPVIQINVAPDQIENAIDEALGKFFDRHYDATEEKFLVHFINDEDIANQYIKMDDKIQAVNQIIKSSDSGAAGVFSAEYQIRLDDYVNREGMYNLQGVTDYYLTSRHFTLMNNLFTTETRFTFNRLTGRLTIQGINYEEYKNNNVPLIIRLYERIADEDETSGEVESVIWKDTWLKRYAAALIKRQWGTNLKKYNGVTMVGGITLDGKTIYDEAVTEIEQLEEELKSSYEEFPSFFIG